ncbi:MAG: hypothetical protein AAF993_21715 [Pseudomonadota bacterium]
MTLTLKILLSPMAFALGFLWPLIAQALGAVALVQNNGTALLLGLGIALLLGAMAQIRGSWIWIK